MRKRLPCRMQRILARLSALLRHRGLPAQLRARVFPMLAPVRRFSGPVYNYNPPGTAYNEAQITLSTSFKKALQNFCEANDVKINKPFLHPNGCMRERTRRSGLVQYLLLQPDYSNRKADRQRRRWYCKPYQRYDHSIWP